MQRIQRDLQAELRVTIYADGDPVDSIAPVVPVTVKRADGTIIDTGNADHIDTGVYEHILTPDLTTDLGELTAEWTPTLGGNVQTFRTHHEIVGRHLFALAALRKLGDLKESKFPADDLAAARDLATYALEEVCRVAFARRAATHELADSALMEKLALPFHRDPTILSATVNGTTLTDTDLANIRVGRGGLLSRRYGAFGHQATITYEHGYETAPPRVARAAMMLARDWLIENYDDALPSRATSWTAGENTYRLITAGVGDAYFDLPEANAVVKAYRE